MLDDPAWDVQWAIWIHETISADRGYLAILGILHGAVGVYVFILGSRLLVSFQSPNEEKNFVQNLRSLSTLTSFFTLLVALGVLSVQTSGFIAWTVRPILLLSGLIVGTFSISLGFLFARNKNCLLTYLGGVTVFVLSFTLGTAMVPFTGREETVFISQAIFFSNSLSLTGVLAYVLSDKECYLSKLMQAIL